MNDERSHNGIETSQSDRVAVLHSHHDVSSMSEPYLIWQGDVELFLDKLPNEPIFDLVVTSPPYNLGKSYEQKIELNEYRIWQERIISKIIPRLKPTGSLCWQVGNHFDQSSRSNKRRFVYPLDYLFHPIFEKFDLILRNRIVWHFGHGLHAKNRFSGRYEVILWYTKTDNYTFNLDPVRIPSKYPGKRHYKGPNIGKYSSHPLGKNPEDVWEIPNVKNYHVEKTIHPCQFPVGLIERLVLALTNDSDLVFDPFCGVASAGVAAAIHQRRFWGCEIFSDYVELGVNRVEQALAGDASYRPHDKPIYDHTKSKLSQRPLESDL